MIRTKLLQISKQSLPLLRTGVFSSLDQYSKHLTFIVEIFVK